MEPSIPNLMFQQGTPAGILDYYIERSTKRRAIFFDGYENAAIAMWNAIYSIEHIPFGTDVHKIYAQAFVLLTNIPNISKENCISYISPCINIAISIETMPYYVNEWSTSRVSYVLRMFDGDVYTPTVYDVFKVMAYQKNIHIHNINIISGMIIAAMSCKKCMMFTPERFVNACIDLYTILYPFSRRVITNKADAEYMHYAVMTSPLFDDQVLGKNLKQELQKYIPPEDILVKELDFTVKRLAEPKVNNTNTIRILKDKNEPEEVGSGSYGMVVSGMTTDGREVAIKSQDDVNAFIKEIALTRALQHDNIVEILTFRFRKLTHVMPLEPYNLNFYLQANSPGSLSKTQVKSFIRQLFKAVVHIHSHGIFHADLKCSNILVTGTDEDARLIITDFGSAVGNTTQLGAKAIAPVVTESHRPIELFNVSLDSPIIVGFPSDIWSCGIICAEIASCISPIMPGGKIDLRMFFNDVKNGKYTMLAEDYVNKIIYKCLSDYVLRPTALQCLSMID